MLTSPQHLRDKVATDPDQITARPLQDYSLLWTASVARLPRESTLRGVLVCYPLPLLPIHLCPFMCVSDCLCRAIVIHKLHGCHSTANTSEISFHSTSGWISIHAVA